MTQKVKPRYTTYRSDCDCLAQVTINDRSADVFVCNDLIIARFSNHPDDYEASHMAQLTFTSNVFLLVAFRLYLEARGGANGEPHSAPLES